MSNTVQSLDTFHAIQDIALAQAQAVPHAHATRFEYSFGNFFHPFVGELIERLNRKSLEGVLDADWHESLATEFFEDFYTALNSPTVRVNHFPKEIDVRSGGPYAGYNWELLFHIPLTIAVHLSKNQRFAEAQRWFHFIFDPTCNDTSIPAPQRFWKFLAFHEGANETQIDELLALLSKPAGECTPAEMDLKARVLAGYEAVKANPFRPHAVARTRQIAYQYNVVMKYLDNLIAWGDSLFRQDTIESINEATQRYVLAANILGPQPQRIPRSGIVQPRSFAQLRAQGLDAMGNALVDLEGEFPFNLGLPQTEGVNPDAVGPLFGIGRTLYFCIPPNDRLLSYWDLVADRLFKIRHCMNIEGVVRQLALFDPPIDPGMLVKAVAAGIDIGSIVSGLNRPASPMRATLLVGKALELCSEVRALGSALLAAVEKADGEHLTLLRQSHEAQIRQLTRELRFLQWKRAEEETEALRKGRALALERYRYYHRVLGTAADDQAAPEDIGIDRRRLTEENFDEAYEALVERYEKAVPVAAYPPLATRAEGRLHLHEGEYDDLNKHADDVLTARNLASASDAVTSALAAIPNFNVKMAYWGIGGESELTGGAFLANIGRAVSAGFNIWAAIEEAAGTAAAKTASFERRADEWLQQENLAAHELKQIGRQILGSLIAEQVSFSDYRATLRQIEQDEELESQLREKFTNEELYLWMQGELSRLYYEYYRFAFDTARQAEWMVKQELMRPEMDETSYIRFNYWDGGRKGLLTGEALCLDLKRLEMAYHENNKREYELTKHVSLRQLDPVALLSLQATGICEFSLPEWLFDMDGPGHYLRRIRHVSLSLPAVTGPYTSVNCTLSLLRNSLRRSPQLADGEYARQGSEDPRFVDYFGTVQSIVTSGATEDAGMFETNLREDRLLPFEGAGACSAWKLELPVKFRQFDYGTVADVILHVRYTARQGGTQMREKAVAHLEELFAEAATSELVQLLSLRHEFSNEWHRFVSGDADFTAGITRDCFPYFVQGREIAIQSLRLSSVTGQEVKNRTVVELDLEGLSGLLNEEGRFELSLASDTEVLVRNSYARVFLLIKYSLGE
jgi:hypothetical protein